MGSEANCVCEWNGETSEVKALLEAPELILRGDIHRRIPFAQIEHLSTDGARLSFHFGQERVCLVLSRTVAPKWAQTILAPPPTLAKKLGIVSGSNVRIVGVIDDEALRDAFRDAKVVGRGKAGLILARVDTPTELAGAFSKTADLVNTGAPIWIVYRKGRGHAINESDVRSSGLAVGLVDVKVVAVSAELTALKFVRGKNPPSKPQ